MCGVWLVLLWCEACAAAVWACAIVVRGLFSSGVGLVLQLCGACAAAV